MTGYPRKEKTSMKLRRLLGAAVAGVLALGVAVLPAGGAGAATEVSVTPVRVIGGPAHAGLYGWGATTLKNGDVLIGDYWNFRVLRFAPDGTAKGVFVANRGFGAQQHQAPYGLATDPVTGDVYMADTDRYKINKYDADGNFLRSFGTQGTGPGKFLYPSRVAVADDGTVYVADTWDNKISVHAPDGTELFQFGSFGAADGQLKQPHGMAFDSRQRLFVANTQNHRIEVFDRQGKFLFKFGSKGSTPGLFVGDLRGVAIDRANNWVYVVDGAGNRISKFDISAATTATYLTRWGTQGQGDGQFLDGGREATVGQDGSVWVGDQPNFRAQRFSPTGGFLGAFPNPPEPPAPDGFNTPRGVAVDAAGNFFVSDTYNWRVVKLDRDGNPVTTWGHRGRSEYQFNYTRMIATDPRDGSVVIADTDNHRIKKFTNDGTFVWQVGALGTKPGLFKNPHGVDVGPDGTVYVADSRNARVQVLDGETGTPIRTFGSNATGPAQLAYPRGIAADPVDGSVWVSDSGKDGIFHFSATGTFLGRVGLKGTADSMLDAPFDVEVDAEHVIVADTSQNKIKIFGKDGSFVGAYGTRGTRLGQLIKPQGLDLVEDRLFIVDSENERIQEWQLATGSTPPPPDTEAPETRITSPAGSSTLPPGPVTVTGTATDNVGATAVRVSVRNTANGAYLRLDGTWSAGSEEWHPALLSSPGAASSDWSFAFVPPTGAKYLVRALAEDEAGNADPTPAARSFTVQ
jgi:tripartite motif-containing protein 71